MGQAKNVAVRIGQHVASGKDFDSYFVIECQRHELPELEYRVITVLKPPENQAGGERYKGAILPIKSVWFDLPAKRRRTKKAA